MRLFKQLILVCILFTIPIKGWAKGAPVLSLVKADNQHDTVGYNLPKSLTSLLYPKILSGEVILYATAKKDIKIGGKALQEIEANTETQFTEAPGFLLNEYWSKKGKTISVEIAGFTFLSINKKGKEVMFGFIEGKAVMPYLKASTIPTNANAAFGLNYFDALKSKRYNYTILQYAGADWTKSSQSFNDFMGKLESQEVRFEYEQPAKVREVYYTSFNNANSGSENKILFEAINQYFAKNPDLFFNNGGNSMGSYLNPNFTIQIDRLEVKQIMRKENGRVIIEPSWVRFYHQGEALTTLTGSELANWDLMVQFRPFIEYLKNSEHTYIITQINHQSIPTEKAQAYRSALFEYDWSKITEYVKYQ